MQLGSSLSPHGVAGARKTLPSTQERGLLVEANHLPAAAVLPSESSELGRWCISFLVCFKKGGGETSSFSYLFWSLSVIGNIFKRKTFCTHTHTRMQASKGMRPTEGAWNNLLSTLSVCLAPVYG